MEATSASSRVVLELVGDRSYGPSVRGAPKDRWCDAVWFLRSFQTARLWMTCTLMVRADDPGCFGYRAVMLATRLGTRSKLPGVSLLLDRLAAWLTPPRSMAYRRVSQNDSPLLPPDTQMPSG